MKPAKALLPLLKDQASAADPAGHAWVAASAGTGKTQVLSARVLRLLLQGVAPHAILCITFTKLAAAEMQERVNSRLAHWASCSDADLAADLAALEAPTDAATMLTARRLFAQVLDAPAGLAVQTIHAFAQGLIASFPVEAQVAPGFATLDDRSAHALQRRLLAEAIEHADAEDPAFLADLAEISIAGGEARLAGIAARLARHGEDLAGLPEAGILPMLRRALGLPTDEDGAAYLARTVAGIDEARLRRIAETLALGGKTATDKLAMLHQWLAAPDRLAAFETLKGVFLTKAGTPHAKVLTKACQDGDPKGCDLYQQFAGWLAEVEGRQRLHAIAAHAARYLRVGKRLSDDWRRAKARLGVIDYDDMIAAARELLAGPRAVDWVRYKLDQRIDHVLVDEAQDTNARQWEIVGALTLEFFAGEGARDLPRSLFVVGDFKQSIFGFQGAQPLVYADKREEFEQLAGDAGADWRNVPLATNFRSVPTILELVDQVIEVLGPQAFDRAEVPRHVAHRQGAGRVTLWPPVEAGTGEEGEGGDDAPPVASEVDLAHKVAKTIAGWLDPADPLILPARGVPVRPQDILVLVRSRSGFSGALVAALHVHRVPVAGVDRLKLTDPLAVADLLALVRFALQPQDDLTLAALLVSPFGGLDHDALFRLAHGRRGALWNAVLASEEPAVVAAREWLGEVLRIADLAAPYDFFERILSGPLGGRARLLARLGEEARDAIDAVLDQALAFEAANPPSLQGFLAWVETDDIEIKRDPEAPLDAVRLMTVHAAKGLQAPVVIMADATRARKKPDAGSPLELELNDGRKLPVFTPSRKSLAGPLATAAEAADADDAREHCRLLYVALTRAEDMLFIGGTLKAGAEDVPEDSWYHSVREAMQALGATARPDAGWDGDVLEYQTGAAKPLQSVDIAPGPDRISLPDWARTPAPQEARPPRPLAPSSIAGDDVPKPPPSPAMRAAARRGTALHALFERLPDLPPEQRRTVGEQWCALTVPELDAAALVSTALAVMDDPRFAAVFAPGALAEAPVAALVGDQVIAGTVDRLLVTDSHVCVVDFKTGRRVPAGPDDVEHYYLAQMGAYAAALRVIFPGRSVSAALLYTEGPTLIELPDKLLQLYHPSAMLRAPGDILISPQ